VREIFPDAVIFRVATMEDVVRLSTADRRFHLVVLALFGGLALLLATIGVGGTLLLSVRDRHQEFAVRMALGARPRRLWWDVQRGGLVLTALGAVAGVSAALAGAGVFASLVYGISVRDPVSLIAGPVLMLVASFLAAAIPAARAVRTNPIVALRE
jgi:ABC-type antimicrobial peptide transport system permease subunit